MSESCATENTFPCITHREKAAPQNTLADGPCTYGKIGPTAVD